MVITFRGQWAGWRERTERLNSQLKTCPARESSWPTRELHLLAFAWEMKKKTKKPKRNLFRHIHILGTYQNIKVAKDALVSLIMGSPPGKVYAQLRTVASRMHERF